MKTTHTYSFGSTVLTLAAFCFCRLTPVHAGGLVAAWGEGDYSQVIVPGRLNNVKALAAGGRHTLALKSDGTVVAWGFKYSGQVTVPEGLAGIRAVAAGGSHSLGLRADGLVVGWGYNGYGQTTIPSSASNVVTIAAGGNHSLALRADGTVVGWGANGAGQSTPPAEVTNIVAVAAGETHSLALKADGTVVGWGWSGSSQINIPPSTTNIVAIAAGNNHSLALSTDGRIIAWGNNTYGQTTVPADATNVVAITAGNVHNLALRMDGSVVGWGNNFYGQATPPSVLSRATAIAAGGNASFALVFDGPVQILQNPQSLTIQYPSTSNITFSVTASGAEPLTYRWLRDGYAIADGARVSGTASVMLTISNTQPADTGTYTVVVSNAFGSVVSSGAVFTVISPPFITQQPADRTVGAGSDVTITASASGTAPLAYQWNSNGTNLPGATFPTLSLYNVQPAASGAYFLTVTNSYGSTQTISASLIVTDSAPYILQQPYVRLLNQTTTTNLVVPIGGSVTIYVSARGSLPLNYQWRFNGVEIPGATNPTLDLFNLRDDQTGFYNVEISNAFGGTNSMKLLLNVSRVVGWGYPLPGNMNMPVGLSNVTALAAGGSHLTALRADGSVRSWFFGSAGYYSSTTNVPVSATNVIAVSAGGDHSLGLRANGTVVAWGNNSYGQTNVPAGLTNIIAIGAGANRNFAVRSNGTVVGWGSSATLPTGLSNVVSVAAGGNHTLALRQDGRVVAWGSSSYGQTNVPVNLSNVIAVAAGPRHSLALRQDGTVRAWGSYSATNVPAGLSNVVALAAGSDYGLALKADGSMMEWGSTGRYPMPVGLSNVVAIAAGGSGSQFSAAVIGDGSPAITLQPASQLVPKGATVRLHARAAGVQPMTYQWQLENQNLPGATNASLLITNARGKDTGGYRMIVSNPLGTVASRTAVLAIPYNTNLAVALNTNNWQWSSGGTTNWFAQIRETRDGNVAAQSGAIPNNQQSILQTVITGPGTLTFWWKVSSEEGFDFLRFYLDSTGTPLFGISGENDWEQRTIHIPTGGHSLRWIYSKDVSVSTGRDAGWLDEVVFTPDPPVIAQQPTPSLILPAGASTTFSVSVSGLGPFSYQWFKDGANLPGATQAILSLTNITRRDSATYRAQVSNAGGSATSSNATLKVIVQQRLGSIAFAADSSIEFLSRDADGGLLLPQDVSAFEAQTSTNLVDWEALPDVLSLTNGALLLRDSNAMSFPKRFYRVVEH